MKKKDKRYTHTIDGWFEVKLDGSVESVKDMLIWNLLRGDKQVKGSYDGILKAIEKSEKLK